MACLEKARYLPQMVLGRVIVTEKTYYRRDVVVHILDHMVEISTSQFMQFDPFRQHKNVRWRFTAAVTAGTAIPTGSRAAPSAGMKNRSFEKRDIIQAAFRPPFLYSGSYIFVPQIKNKEIRKRTLEAALSG